MTMITRTPEMCEVWSCTQGVTTSVSYYTVVLVEPELSLLMTLQICQQTVTTTQMTVHLL